MIFLGGIFLPCQKRQIESDEMGVLQSAADALQKALIAGLAEVTNDDLRVVNLPFIGSFPQAYRRWRFPAAMDRIKGADAQGMGFINIRFVRVLSRFLAAWSGITKAYRAEKAAVVIYSAELPLVAAAALHQIMNRGKICIVLPDLPEFVGEVSWWRRTVLEVEGRIFRACLRRFACFIVLTEAMAERLNLPKDRFVVVEGMIDLDQIEHSTTICLRGGLPFFLYTGAIERRYGIIDLIKAFQSLDRGDIRLVICGEGGAREDVVALASRDARIEYLGQIPRETALALQMESYALVNPRPPVGEYTRYSFPSKTLEYLSTGRPVIMHDLPGVPAEYAEHVIISPTPDIKGLSLAMGRALELSPDAIQTAAIASRRFLESRKTPAKQCARIADLILREAH